MNAVISEATKARKLGLGLQILEFIMQRKFISTKCQAHSNSHKLPKTGAHTVKVLEIKF